MARRVLPSVAILLALAAGSALAGDEEDRAFEFHRARAKELAARAAAGDAGAGREALEELRLASVLRPKDPLPIADRGLLALDLGDGAEAAKALAALSEAAPESFAFRFLRGSVLLRRGEYEDALAEFAKAKGGDFRPAQAEDRWFECKVGLGFQHVEAYRFDRALEVLGEAVALRPDHPLVPRAWLNIALAHRRLQSPVEAEKALRTCVGRFPSFAPGWAELGDLLTDLNRTGEALEALDRAVKSDPGFPRGWLLRASALTARGDFRAADAAFAEFERKFPPTGESEMERGVYHLRAKEPEKALDRLRRALALDPSRFRCHYHLAQASASFPRSPRRWSDGRRRSRPSGRPRRTTGGSGGSRRRGSPRHGDCRPGTVAASAGFRGRMVASVRRCRHRPEARQEGESPWRR